MLAGLVLLLAAGPGAAAGASPGRQGSLGVVDSCPAGAAPGCREETARIAGILDAAVDGGTFGFVLYEVGGGVLASLNPHEPFYPASSIKVLYLLHALAWAAGQDDMQAALQTPVLVQADGCGGPGSSWAEPLQVALWAMMQRSDNLRANAVGDFFGLPAINQTAAAAGIGSGSLVAHRFACGGPANDPANRMTAAELAGVYARYGDGSLLDPDAAAAFASLMLGMETGLLDRVIAAEAQSRGFGPELVARFRAGVEIIYKAGWWGTNLSIAGYAALPERSGPALDSRGFAFALFVSGADAVAPGFEMTAMVGEMLRGPIGFAMDHFVWPVRPYPLPGPAWARPAFPR